MHGTNYGKATSSIEGDAQSQQDVHSMLYHLYSFVRKATATAQPMGLNGLIYNNCVFGIQSCGCFPPFCSYLPNGKESMVEYRFERLEAAKRNAYGKGYKGAMYPWEVPAPAWKKLPCEGPFRHQHHMRGNLRFAWNYYCVTQDKTGCVKKAGHFKNTADFWASRVSVTAPIITILKRGGCR